MPLVSYSSSDTEDDDVKTPASKRRRGNGRDDASKQKIETQSKMPPLPDAFHDLYASTVRQSTVDDPNLHQGRKRQNPHVVGQWPSHVYIEWNPDPEQHRALSNLLTAVSTALGGQIHLHQFLTSDLGAALPLHISLSRPLSLSTDEKEKFLDQVSSHIQQGRVSKFYVSPKRLAWFTSPDSNRTFLVLQVESITDSHTKKTIESSPNPELMSLLKSSNTVAGMLGKPLLYQRGGTSTAQGSEFHVSIAWTFDTPSDEDKARASAVFDGDEEAGRTTISQWRIETCSVKVKIGNVVSSVSLLNSTSGGRGAAGLGSRLLLEEQ